MDILKITFLRCRNFRFLEYLTYCLLLWHTSLARTMKKKGQKKKPREFLLNYINKGGIWRLQTKLTLNSFLDY